MSEEIAGPAKVGDRRKWIAAWIVTAIVTVLAVWRLRDFPYHLSWIEALHGMSEVLPATLWAAVRVWIFWAWSAAVLAGIILRIDSEIDLSDAILGGVGGVWVLGYFLGVILGPLHLFNTATLWSLLALGTVWLWYHRPPIRRAPMTSGQKLALLAAGLLAISMLPLQLASPVAPFMDVLAVPSAAQRVVTFGVYLPYDNDPYGVWVPAAQSMGLELFLAMLAFGADLHFAAGALAQSQAMLPICVLMIFAVWRLGKTLFSDTTGGVAALLLFWTCLFRRAQGVRGAVDDLALMGLGLAFFLDRSHRRTLVALGAMTLGAAVGSYSLDGGLAMIVASVGVIFWLVESGFRLFLLGVLCLAGATLTTVPQLSVSLGLPLPYVALAVSVLAGIALIVAASTRFPLSSNAFFEKGSRILNILLVAAFILAIVQWRYHSIFQRVVVNLPLLSFFCATGLVLAIIIGWRDKRPAFYAGLAAVALSFGLTGEYIDVLAHTPQYSKTLLWDVAPHFVDYWCPFFLIFPAAYAFALAYDRWSRPLVFIALLTLLIYPWHMVEDPVYYDSLEHSISEHWGFNLHMAAQGYWAGTADSRWTLDGNGRALVNLLKKEVAAGRITPATHILHLTDQTSAWGLAQVAIFTGIDDDPIDFHYEPNNPFQAGSRVRGLSDLPAALSHRPPYILEQCPAPNWVGDPPAGYETIFDRANLRLYRRSDLAKNSDVEGLVR